MNTKEVMLNPYFGFPMFLTVPRDMVEEEIEDIKKSLEWTMKKGYNCDGKHLALHEEALASLKK